MNGKSDGLIPTVPILFVLLSIIVNLSFRTDDQTIAHVASVALDKSELKFSIEKVMTGSRANPSVSYQVTDAQQLTAFVMPEEAENK